MDESGQNKTLSKKQQKTIASILTSKNVTEAIKKVKVGRSTYYSWLQNEPLFKETLEQKLKEIIDTGIQELKISFEEAIAVLKSLLKSRNEAIKFRAASQMIEYTNRFIQYEDLDKRVNEIEKSMNIK